MNPAVRDPKGACIEESNCNWERATLCAFSNSTVENRVSFLACMDGLGTTPGRQLLGGGGGGTSALDAGKQCAPASKVDPDALESCYNGAQGDQLLSAASAVFNKAFPKAASVPHTNVNGKEVNADFTSLAAALCKAGSTSPHCHSAQGRLNSCTI